MALIDEGETDWKVIAIDINDPLASKLNDIEDVRKTMPGLIEATHEWFKVYKMPTGAPANEFAFNGEAKNSLFTKEIVMQTHEQWKKLVQKETANEKRLGCENVSVEGSPYKINEKEADAATDALPDFTAPADLPVDVDTMYYLTDIQTNVKAK